MTTSILLWIGLLKDIGSNLKNSRLTTHYRLVKSCMLVVKANTKQSEKHGLDSGHLVGMVSHEERLATSSPGSSSRVLANSSGSIRLKTKPESCTIKLNLVLACKDILIQCINSSTSLCVYS